MMLQLYVSMHMGTTPHCDNSVSSSVKLRRWRRKKRNEVDPMQRQDDACDCDADSVYVLWLSYGILMLASRAES